MLWAGGALDGADFPVGPALAPPPAGALVPAELPPAVGSEVRFHRRAGGPPGAAGPGPHSGGGAPPPPASTPRTPPTPTQPCRRRPPARSGPAYGAPGG